MITFVAFIVFFIATIWNMIYFGTLFAQILKNEKTDWLLESVAMAISLSLWFVLGVYLFGWF